MRPANELKETDIDSVTVALTGDGSSERIILKALAERYDGNEQTLLIPFAVALLGHGYRKTGRFCGLSALQAIKIYIGKYRFRRYLLLADIEHINEGETIEAALGAKAREYGLGLQRIEPIGNQAFLIRCRVGSHEILVHTVISGRDKCIEENISALINLEWGIDIEPLKTAIHRIWKQKKTDLLSLMRNASSYNLRQAFPGLTAAFESMEQAY